MGDIPTDLECHFSERELVAPWTAAASCRFGISLD